MDEVLKPCKCGGEACLRTMCVSGKTLYFVQCGSCKAASRVYYMPDEAVLEWKENNNANPM